MADKKTNPANPTPPAHNMPAPASHVVPSNSTDFENPEFREFLKNRCPQLAEESGHTAMGGGSGFDWVAIIELAYRAWQEWKKRPVS